LGRLVRRQAHELSDTRWEYDAHQLVVTLEKALGKPALGAPDPQERAGGGRSPASRPMVKALILLISGIMVAVGLGTVFSWIYPSIEINFNLAFFFMLVGWLLVSVVWGIWQTIGRRTP
jgi:hypothetical protein